MQRGVSASPPDDASCLGMGDPVRDGQTSLITEHMIRGFWRGYRALMGWS